MANLTISETESTSFTMTICSEVVTAALFSILTVSSVVSSGELIL